MKFWAKLLLLLFYPFANTKGVSEINENLYSPRMVDTKEKQNK